MLPATALAIVVVASCQAKHHHGCGARGAIGVVIIAIISLSGCAIAIAIFIIVIIESGSPRGMRHKRHILFFRGLIVFVVEVVGLDFVMAIPIGLALYYGFRSTNPFKPIGKPSQI